MIKEIGHALYLAQAGGKHRNAKPLKGYKGAGVIEIVTMDESGTFRAVYTIIMPPFIYVLHVFQKKSLHGIETSKKDLALILMRLNEAREINKRKLKI